MLKSSKYLKYILLLFLICLSIAVVVKIIHVISNDHHNFSHNGYPY